MRHQGLVSKRGKLLHSPLTSRPTASHTQSSSLSPSSFIAFSREDNSVVASRARPSPKVVRRESGLFRETVDPVACECNGCICYQAAVSECGNNLFCHHNSHIQTSTAILPYQQLGDPDTQRPIQYEGSQVLYTNIGFYAPHKLACPRGDLL